MIKTHFKNLIPLLFFVNAIVMHSQDSEAQLIADNPDSFIENLTINKSKKLFLNLSKKNTSLSLNVKVEKVKNDLTTFIGSVNNQKLSTFALFKTKNQIEGTLVLRNEKTGYKIFTNDLGKVYIEEVDINSLVCIDFKASQEEDNADTNSVFSKMAPQLESLPGAPGIVYLDFDGEVVSETIWASGGTINAQSPNFSDQKIIEIWKIMAEDFRPFNINITTNRAIYEAAPKDRRTMAIFTPTDSAAPGAGGIAILNSFSLGNLVDAPCWVFNLGTRSAGETGSHEVGHTLGLSHDGVPGNSYYAGHGQWSPIMGWSSNKPIGQWSKGEYPNATEPEDDMAIISRDLNGFGYRPDDHGDTITESSDLIVNTNGDVNASQNTGLISTREDKDVFSFVTSGGTVEFNFEPDPYYPNLNIEARILNDTGAEIAISSPSQDLSASISSTLAGGKYFIEIDGVGEGDLSTGYSDYASVGLYSISGSYPIGAPIANFEVTTDCNNTVTFRSTSINAADTYLWDFGDGTSSALQNPEHTYTNSGQYTVSLTATNDIGSDTHTKDNVISIPSQPDSDNQTACPGESIAITASGSIDYVWYDQPQNGTILGTGNTLTISELTQNQSYYVSGTSAPIVTATAGLSDINFNSGDIIRSGLIRYLVFDAMQPILLTKAKVFAQGAKDRTLELKDAEGNIITSKTINIPNGESIIDLNLYIPAGTNLLIGFENRAVNRNNLFYSYGNINYPFEVPGVLTIKESTSSNSQSFYYYLYDWQITTLGRCETDTRTEVVITVADSPEIPIITSTEGTDEISVPDIYAAYQWYRDGVIIEGATNSNLFVDQTGLYLIEVSNNEGCTATSESIEVETLSIPDPETFLNNIVVYPNPANNVLYINGLDNSKDIYSVKVVNMLGQPIIKHNSAVTFVDTTLLEEGIYFLVINNRFTKKFLKSYL
ncbi:PKD domain-containing protein [uncultured Aquimarina sp.]|uniref:PKD domain-containing protein n=1 Tax=uncultured Aquimarina sp. TaxID=575652 RepID=UPI002622D627|nr:PKD domain-containing protein [uncultured Aquimarina sp.]